jgi:hypothetical protein
MKVNLENPYSSGKLDHEQFALAMWLVKQTLSGVEPPRKLAQEMVPPSIRNIEPIEGMGHCLFQKVLTRVNWTINWLVNQRPLCCLHWWTMVIYVWQGVAMDSLKFHPGPACPTLLRPAGRFGGGPPAGLVACGRLLPFWKPYAYDYDWRHSGFEKEQEEIDEAKKTLEETMKERETLGNDIEKLSEEIDNKKNEVVKMEGDLEGKWCILTNRY